MSTEELLKGKKEIVKRIKNKKELRNLSDDFIERILISVLDKNNKKLDLNLRSKKSKFIIKEVRKILHGVYGVFSLDLKKREKLFLELKDYIKKNKKIDEHVLELHRGILSTHRSTKERLDDYEKIYDKIFSLKVNSILDLGSGLNVFSYVFMKRKIRYIANELSKEDCDFIQEYFNLMKGFGLKGSILEGDLFNIEKFPKTDACFMFKLLDSLEEIKRNFSKDLLEKIKSKYVIISFPTKTLSGKLLSKKRLAWFNKLIKDYESFEVWDEVFYIIKR